jgi:hypothetical protein
METTNKVKLVTLEYEGNSRTAVYDVNMNNLEIAVAVLYRIKIEDQSFPIENLELPLSRLATLSLDMPEYTLNLRNRFELRIKVVETQQHLEPSKEEPESPKDEIDVLFCSMDGQQAGCESDFVKITESRG